MKKEKMIAKINKNYKGEQLTVEDLQDRLKLVRRTRIPFAICSSIGFVILVSLAE
jgi:hypothetical protein